MIYELKQGQILSNADAVVSVLKLKFRFKSPSADVCVFSWLFCFVVCVEGVCEAKTDSS
jgi:hypothetical protein